MKGFSGTHFFTLLNVFAKRFNWGFQDGYPDFWIIQGSLVFSLYMVQQKAKNPVSEDVLANAFISLVLSLGLVQGSRKNDNTICSYHGTS